MAMGCMCTCVPIFLILSTLIDTVISAREGKTTFIFVLIFYFVYNSSNTFFLSLIEYFQLADPSIEISEGNLLTFENANFHTKLPTVPKSP